MTATLEVLHSDVVPLSQTSSWKPRVAGPVGAVKVAFAVSAPPRATLGPPVWVHL